MVTPDPDGIGSALAHKRLCERKGVSATIAHVLTAVALGETARLVKLLNVPMVRVSEMADLEAYGYLALSTRARASRASSCPKPSSS